MSLCTAKIVKERTEMEANAPCPGFNANDLVCFQKKLACFPQCNLVTLSCFSEAFRSSAAQLLNSRYVYSNGDRRNSSPCWKLRKVSIGIDNAVLSDGISKRTPYHEPILHRRKPCLEVC